MDGAHIWNMNLKEKIYIYNFKLGALPFQHLNLNKSENSSPLKVPDVGIKKKT